MSHVGLGAALANVEQISALSVPMFVSINAGGTAQRGAGSPVQLSLTEHVTLFMESPPAGAPSALATPSCC